MFTGRIPSTFSTYLLKLIVLGSAICLPHILADSGESDVDRNSHVAAQRKNILMIVVDDLRPEVGTYASRNVKTYVYPRIYTPNLDKLATSSLVFHQAHVQFAICGPSRSSMLTGRRPDTTIVYSNQYSYRDRGANFTTLPQYFKINGYLTLGVGKIFHARWKGLRKSGRRNTLSPRYDNKYSWSAKFKDFKDRYRGHAFSWRALNNTEWKDTPTQDDRTTDYAVRTIRNFARLSNLAITDEPKPLFFAVGLRKPHLPFIFPDEFLKYYPKQKVRLATNRQRPSKSPLVAAQPGGELLKYDDARSAAYDAKEETYGGFRLPRKKAVELRRAYYATVSYTDYNIGRVLDEVKSQGLYNNTIIVVVSDHGWHLGEQHGWCKNSNFDSATRVPLIIRIPGLTDRGMNTTKLVELVDLFPTLVEATGLPHIPLCPVTPLQSMSVESCVEGSSFYSLFRKPTNDDWSRPAFSQVARYHAKVMGYSVRTNRYRFTDWVQFDRKLKKPHWDQILGTELYDHKVDPLGTKNLAGSDMYSSKVKILRSLVRKGWAKWHDASQQYS